MSDDTCPVCGKESEKTYRCSHCGKLFDSGESAGGSRRWE